MEARAGLFAACWCATWNRLTSHMKNSVASCCRPVEKSAWPLPTIARSMRGVTNPEGPPLLIEMRGGVTVAALQQALSCGIADGNDVFVLVAVSSLAIGGGASDNPFSPSLQASFPSIA